MTSPEPQTDFQDISQSSDKSSIKRRRSLILLLAFILIISGGTAIAWRWFHPRNQTAITNIKTPGVRVKISTVQIGMVQESSDFVASLESQRSVEIPSKIPGQVTKILLKSGDSVVAGTAILQVDSRQVTMDEINASKQAAITQRENSRMKLQSLEAERQSYLSNLQLQQQDYQRYADLADQGAVSRRTRDQYATRLNTAKARLAAINTQIQAEKSNLSQAEKAVQQAEINLKNRQTQPQNYRITAPFSGTIGNIAVQVGDLVNTSTPLVQVSQNQPLEANISVSPAQSSQLRPGIPLEILDTQGQVISSSKISDISPDTNSEDKSLVVKALLNNSANALKPHQLVRARVILNERSGVLIPTKAISRMGAETFVYIVEKEELPQGGYQLIARQRRVKLGNIKDDNYQILAGLEAEDQIITSGLLNVKDGVSIVPES
ncbi:efflux RND transporter periplasmic adaptor subunit [Nodularia harveyana UHCC-0300]|uniref:Efflux RND transporter periplasmic adaptor subunit n=1 Tax=Nodularia harveyana UHCC-0300 TaxID=2974287 RepID=A0ABU5UHW6_9CYAN|nr:efflux RND transporter periplasmic adaptor subunit [Nodularia harveyana]MEA5582705.1 efflux RND transporter periplasmic adaptor subunit [Nodularia harveyana UHCC-0300]